MISVSGREMQREGLHEQISGVDENPDKGFHYNVGREFWKPDFNQYSPEAREILTALGIDAPKNLDDLAVNLSRMKEGFKQTGCPASPQPVRILEETNPRYNGSADYASGNLWIYRSYLQNIKSAMRQGTITTQGQMDAFKTLTHEYGHLLGYPTDIVRYNQDDSYRLLGQAINDLWARQSIPEIAKSLKLAYSEQAWRTVMDYHPTAYQPCVSRLREILKKVGLEAIEQKALMTELNTMISPEDYSKRLWMEVQRKKPALIPMGHFGELLRKPERFNWIMGELG